MSLQGEPTRGGVAAPVSATDAETDATASAPSDADSATATAPPGTEPERVDAVPVEDLESDLFTVRDLDGEELEKVRRTLSQARSEMSEATYRRALVLARDSVLLSLEECMNGAVAMEWEPVPRPEFSLETIEAAVAEQERNGQGRAGQPEGRTA